METSNLLGYCTGGILGISPFISLQGIVVLLILLLFRVQFGMAFVSAFIFKFLFTFLAPVMHQLGSFTLEIESFKTLYTWGTNTPLIPFTKFNHSVVMGGLIVGIILAPVNYFLSLYMIRKYRSSVVERVKNSKMAKLSKHQVFTRFMKSMTESTITKKSIFRKNFIIFFYYLINDHLCVSLFFFLDASLKKDSLSFIDNN